MVSLARRKLLGKERKAVYHVWSRCVRGAFLFDAEDSDRRYWVMNREDQLAGLFAIEIEFRAEMRNHMHLILRTRPEIVQRWSDEEVVRRWLIITKLAKCMTDDLPSPDPVRTEELLGDKKAIKRIRRRLSSISWFMGTLCENIARRANKADGKTGHFWESRFKCRECSDKGALLICGIYVDLNPNKAGEASGPETARFTSAYARIWAIGKDKDARDRADAWMAELTLRPERKDEEQWAYRSRTGRRASDMGIFPFSLEVYLQILRWTQQMLASGQRETIPKNLLEVMDRLQLNHEAWLDTIENYDDIFGHVVGSPAALESAAERMGLQGLKGTVAAHRIYK